MTLSGRLWLLFFSFKIYFYCMYVVVLPKLCLYTMCVQCPGGQKTALDLWVLEWQAVVNFPMVAANWNQVLCKGSQCSWPMSHFSSPWSLFLIEDSQKVAEFCIEWVKRRGQNFWGRKLPASLKELKYRSWPDSGMAQGEEHPFLLSQNYNWAGGGPGNLANSNLVGS